MLQTLVIGVETPAPDQSKESTLVFHEDSKEADIGLPNLDLPTDELDRYLTSFREAEAADLDETVD